MRKRPIAYDYFFRHGIFTFDNMTRQKEIPPIVTQVGTRIADIIKAKEIKVRHLAHAADMDENTLRRYLKGTQVMGIDKLHLIAVALGIDLGELFKSK